MIQAIETQYRGYRFRSRIEARWAVFFDALSIRWEYEKEGFECGEAGRYLPDFYLPDVNLRTTGGGPGLWVEVKGGEVSDRDEKKINALVKGLRIPLALLCGPVQNRIFDRVGDYDGHYQYDWYESIDSDGRICGEIGWDNCMVFMKCYTCGRVKYEFSEGSYCVCETCKQNNEKDYQCDDEHPDFEKAIELACSSRFGERGGA